MKFMKTLGFAAAILGGFLFLSFLIFPLQVESDLSDKPDERIPEKSDYQEILDDSRNILEQADRLVNRREGAYKAPAAEMDYSQKKIQKQQVKALAILALVKDARLKLKEMDWIVGLEGTPRRVRADDQGRLIGEANNDRDEEYDAKESLFAEQRLEIIRQLQEQILDIN